MQQTHYAAWDLEQLWVTHTEMNRGGDVHYEMNNRLALSSNY